MKGFVSVTDNDWFTFLSQKRRIDEVNFWRSSRRGQFRELDPGEPFLFKLSGPYNHIVGGGFFAHSTILPVSLAWDAFGEKNGAGSLEEMRRSIERRRADSSDPEDYKIGCIVLIEPFFFKKKDWIRVPADFSANIDQDKTYDLSRGYGERLWVQVVLKLMSKGHLVKETNGVAELKQRYGAPIPILPRLGQGSFQVIVTDAYERRCAITEEETLPALEAAHIRPFDKGGPHHVENGILLRADIHKLFDAGYFTVTTDYKFEVSRCIREEFDTSKHYSTLHGKTIYLPSNPRFKPSPAFLSWHNENVFGG